MLCQIESEPQWLSCLGSMSVASQGRAELDESVRIVQASRGSAKQFDGHVEMVERTRAPFDARQRQMGPPGGSRRPAATVCLEISACLLRGAGMLTCRMEGQSA